MTGIEDVEAVVIKSGKRTRDAAHYGQWMDFAPASNQRRSDQHWASAATGS
jgi:hypothetical protein